MTKILVISRSLKFSRILDYTLSHYGFTVEVANKADKLNQLLEEIKFNLILLDLPFECDLEVLKNYPAPVIAVGDTYDEVSIIENMYRGIDDYILRPINISELRMIMNKLLERSYLLSNPLVVGDMKIDVTRNIIIIKDKIISLGKKEFEVMIKLARKAGRYVRPDSLVTKERISALRRKIEKEAGNVLEIKHIKGLGFKLVAPMF